MEQKLENTQKTEKKVVMDHKIIIDNRKKITLTAITKAISANENSVILQMANQKVYIQGKDLHINKLDVNDGVAEVVGEIIGVKYLVPSSPQGFFKRVFK